MSDDISLLAETFLSSSRLLKISLDAMSETAIEFAEDTNVSLTRLLQELKTLRSYITTLKQIDSLIESVILPQIKANQTVVEGVGTIERTGGGFNRKWDTERLLPRLLALSADERRILDEETGEFEQEGEAFLRVLKEVAHIDYFRVGKEEEKSGLKGRGLDPDDFSDKERQARHIVIK